MEPVLSLTPSQHHIERVMMRMPCTTAPFPLFMSIAQSNKRFTVPALSTCRAVFEMYYQCIFLKKKNPLKLTISFVIKMEINNTNLKTACGEEDGYLSFQGLD